jgi:hypothetical protein
MLRPSLRLVHSARDVERRSRPRFVLRTDGAGCVRRWRGSCAAHAENDAHLEGAGGEEDAALTVGESAARLGVRRAEPS